MPAGGGGGKAAPNRGGGVQKNAAGAKPGQGGRRTYEAEHGYTVSGM